MSKRRLTEQESHVLALLEKLLVPEWRSKEFPEVPSGKESSLDAYLNDPHKLVNTLSITLDDAPILMGTSYSLLSGTHKLQVIWNLKNYAGEFFDKVSISPGKNCLNVEFWHEFYPPYVELDSNRTNPAPGLYYRSQPGADEILQEIAFQYDAQQLLFCNEGQTLGEVGYLRYDLWIDNNYVGCEHLEFINQRPPRRGKQKPSFFRTKLTCGLHRLVVGDRNRHRLLFDGEILLHPFCSLRVIINSSNGTILIIDDKNQEIFKSKGA